MSCDGIRGVGASGAAGGWLALAAAGALLPFANGRWALGLAAWLAPALVARFVRTRPPAGGAAVTWLMLSGAWAVQFHGMAPLPPLGFAALALGFGLVGFVPLAVDRFVAARIDGFLSTLALPSVWASLDFLVARLSPYGSWGSPAYAQHGDLPLLQLLALTGLPGVAFLPGWFAATANWAWERRRRWPEARRGVAVFAAVLAVVVLGGEARLQLRRPAAPTVRVAALSAPDLDLFPDSAAARRLRAGRPVADADVAAVRERGRAIDDDLLRRSEREARAGAKLVFWAEASGFAFKEDEPALLERGRDLARREGIYLGMAYAAWSRGAARPLENVLALVGPRGEIEWRFLKAIPVPGPEAAISARGDGRLPVAATPYGRVGGAICFDMDFPRLLAQAGRLGVDILIVPSGDWRAIDPFHTDMARFRAIEQGFNLVRQVNRGLSAACDRQGRIVAAADYFTAADRDLVAQVPTRGARTVYARTGDAFAWACVAASLLLLALAAARRG